MLGAEKESSENKQINLLWRSFIKGKQWAFTKIYEDTYADMYRYGLKHIQNPELIKDLIHDVFFKLWQNKNNLSNSSNINIKAYLLKSLRGTILNHLRDEKKNVLNNSLDFDLISSIEDTHTAIDSEKIDTKKLKEEIQKLSTKQKEAIYLHYIFRLTYKEVAEVMNINIQSVRNVVFEGLQKLRNISGDFVK